MSLAILVLNQRNLGGETHMYIISNLIESIIKQPHELSISQFSSIKTIPVETTHLIIGGGISLDADFVNDVEKLITESNYKGKVLALSCELDSPELCREGKLDFIDFFMVRNRNDAKVLQKRFGLDLVSYQPDLLTLLDGYSDLKLEKYRSKSEKLAEKVALCVSRSAFKNDTEIDQMIIFIQVLTNFKVKVYLVSFDESDLLFNLGLENRLANNKRVYFVKPKSSDDRKKEIKNILETLSEVGLVICSEYSPHIYSAILNKPFISISDTKQTQKLLDDWKLNELKISAINLTSLIEKYAYIITNYMEIKVHLGNIAKLTNTTADLLEKYISEFGLPARQYEVQKSEVNKFINQLKTNIKVKYNIDNFRMTIGDNLKNRITEYILFQITRDPRPHYHCELSSKIFTSEFNFDEEIAPIYYSFVTKNAYEPLFRPTLSTNPSEISQKYNIDYIKQNSLDGYHRSGWSFIVNNLGLLHDKKSPIIMETYADKVFLWGRQLYQDVGLIPYVIPWIGFLHHTPNVSYSDNNLVRLIETPVFQQSLKHCKALIVFSDYLKQWLIANDITIPVVVLKHPTKKPFIGFEPDRYTANPNKKLIQIGAWLRNPYAIYEVKSPIQKMHLVGKDMFNQVKPDNLDLETHYYQVINQTQKPIPSPLSLVNWSMCRDPSVHTFMRYLNLYINDVLAPLNLSDEKKIAILENNQQSVTIKTQISDTRYDLLLSENLVFVNLVDASACNTIIECIVRNTPIIINRLPAVIEYLGVNYPLYYENLSQVPELITDEKIQCAYEYLSQLDKSALDITFFIKTLNSSLKSI